MPLPAPHILARVALVAGGTVCAIGMVGPFQGVEEALIPWDKAAHFVAFYGLIVLLFLALPHRRRIDLTFMAILAGAGVELAQALSGRDADIGDILANALGACAVLAPTFIEPLRSISRAPDARPVERRGAERRAAGPAPAAPETASS